MEDKKTPKISVIAPVYGVERFIAHTMESMMNQTLNDVEFIFVDDCSPDNSIAIIKKNSKKYPQRTNQIIIIQHEENKGLPTARNTGLEAAKGEYIFHWDSDDYAEPTMLEEMYKKASEEHCDYVWCDWFLTFNTTSRYMIQPSVSSPREALSKVLAGVMKYNVWNKLVSRKLYIDTNIRFPDGKSMGEDMTMIKLLTHANHVGHIRKAFYHYIRTNTDAMTQIYSARHLEELKKNVEDIQDYLLHYINDEQLQTELHWFYLNVKLPFLFSGRKEDIKRWNTWYPESNKFIMSNKNQSIRTRLLQMTAYHHLSFINRLYNSLVNNFIYGLLYK